MRKLFVVLVLIFMIAAIAPAQDLGLYAIAPKVGVLFPEGDWDTGFLFGAKANLGELSEDLELMPFALYWTAGYDEFGLDFSLSNIQIGGDVHYFLPNIEGLYVGGGLSLNFVSSEYPSFNLITLEETTESDTETKIGFGFLAGYEIPMGDSYGFVEGKYNIISDLNTFEIEVGYYFPISK